MAQAASKAPNKFRVIHVTESSSNGEHSVNDFPLLLKFYENVTSKTMHAVDPSADTDGDDDNDQMSNVESILRIRIP